MNETKFTPGPWIGVGPSFGEPKPVYINAIITDREDEDECFEICHLGLECYDEEQEANAHLIAAAPELYEVVERLAKWNKDYPSSRVYGYGDIKQIAAEMDEINTQAQAALAKARGEE